MGRNLLDIYIEKRRDSLQKKADKHHLFSDWWYCVVNGKSYKKVQFLKRIKMYIHGFESDAYVNYSLDKNNYKDYLTETQRWKSRGINGAYNIVLDDKRLFYEAFSSHVKIPKTVLNIVHNVVTDYETQEEIKVEDILEYIKKYKGLAFRPASSGGGKYVSIVVYKDGKYDVNGNLMNDKDTIEFLKTQCDDVVTEYVFQHEYANKIFPKSVNTIRVVTTQMKDGQCIIPIALHRFGTEKSKPVDNACSGGIFAMVDVDTGRVGPCKSYLTNDTYYTHPDTGEKIDGIIIPRWDEIKEKVIKIANKFPYIKFIGWDIVVTEDDFAVIEGNTSTGFGFFQMFGPAKNSKIGEFYKENGIVK